MGTVLLVAGLSLAGLMCVGSAVLLVRCWKNTPRPTRRPWALGIALQALVLAAAPFALRAGAATMADRFGATQLAPVITGATAYATLLLAFGSSTGVLLISLALYRSHGAGNG
jgi:hypothetical protein